MQQDIKDRLRWNYKSRSFQWKPLRTKVSEQGPPSVLTWSKQAVQITDDSSEGRPEVWLIIHASIYKVCQLCPLGCRELVLIFIELQLLQLRAKR